jgi:hypothetical protein
VLETDAALFHFKRPGIGRIHDLVRLAHQFQRFGQRAELLEIIQHAEGKLLHAGGDLVGEEEDHRENADIDIALDRVVTGERHHAQHQRLHGQRHEHAHEDEEPAQAA